MIEAVVGLLMFWDGEIKEHRIQESMAAVPFESVALRREKYNPNNLINAYVVKLLRNRNLFR